MTSTPVSHIRLEADLLAEARAAARDLPRHPNGTLNVSGGVRALVLLGVDVLHGRSLGPFTPAGLAELDRLALEGETRTDTAKRLLGLAAGVIAAENARQGAAR